MYGSKDNGTPKDNEKAFGSGSTKTETPTGESHTKEASRMELSSCSMKTETPIGESHTKMAWRMEFRSVLMNKETLPKPFYGKMEN
jgi:hypothetical protein